MNRTPLMLALSAALSLLVLAGCTDDAPIAERGQAGAPESAPAATPEAGPTAGGTPVESQVASPVEAYAKRAAGLSAMIHPGMDIELGLAEAESLMELGIEIKSDFLTRHPHCADYLEAAMAVRTGWRDMDLETIERDYHNDGALPETENVAVCYHMKDLIVHPATAMVILSSDDPDFAKARHEIDEVVAHASVVGAS